MRAHDVIFVSVTGLLAAAPLAHAQLPAQPLPFDRLAAVCAPDVHPATLKGVVNTESSGNPYAIGVVGGRLERQPRSLAEAVATAHALERQGLNFSMGLGQVNRYNLAKYGERYETVFEPCRNLKAGSAILKDCFTRAKARIGDDQQALRAAFSCYYSGNFTRGFRPDQPGQPSYVQKVVANATGDAQPIPVVPAVKPDSTDSAIPVRPMGRPLPSAKPATPTQWVIFAGSQQESPSAAHAEASAKPAVKVQIVTPDDAPAVAVPRGEQAHPPVQQARPQNNAQQDTPFVQFVN